MAASIADRTYSQARSSFKKISVFRDFVIASIRRKCSMFAAAYLSKPLRLGQCIRKVVTVGIDQISGNCSVFQPDKEHKVRPHDPVCTVFFIERTKRVLACSSRVPVLADVSLVLQLCAKDRKLPR